MRNKQYNTKNTLSVQTTNRVLAIELIYNKTTTATKLIQSFSGKHKMSIDEPKTGFQELIDRPRIKKKEKGSLFVF